MKIDIAWDESNTVFEWDGSWRDIYVLETTRDDWRRLLAHLRANHPEMTIDEKPLSGSIDFEAGRGHCLTFSAGRIALNCHFFSECEIEFDFDPQDVTEQDIRTLAAFMAEIGGLLDKVVVLTPENASFEPIYRYDPKARAVTYLRP